MTPSHGALAGNEATALTFALEAAFLGRVELPAVAPLALGAVGGALVGVQLVHIEGAVHVGRVVLSFVLVFVAARFAYEAMKKKVEAPR